MSQERTRGRAADPGRRIRKQTSRREREEQIQRFLLAAIAIGVLAAFLVVLVPLIKRNVFDPRQTLAVVGEQRVTRALYDKQQALNAVQLTNTEILLQIVEPLRTQEEQLRTNISQAVEQARAGAVGQPDAQVVDQLVNDAVLAQFGSKVGVTVTEAEVDREISESFAPTTPTPAATGTPGAGETPAAEETQAAGATTPAAAASTPGATPAAAAASPTARPASEEDIAQVFGLIEDTTGASREDFERLVVRPTLMRERYLEKQAPQNAEQVHVRHILVADEAAAKQALADLKAGRKFEDVARERSTDQSNSTKGGDLGWAPRGVYDAAFERAAFALRTPGQLSGAVKSSFGWHVIQLLQRDNDRPLSEQQRQQVGASKLQRFLEAERARLEQADQLSIEIPPTPTPAPTTTAPTPDPLG